jgi:hypothetical protein
VLVFLQAVTRDADAESLTARVSTYIDGQFRKTFKSTDDLEGAIQHAVSTLMKRSDGKAMSDEVIPQRIARRPRINNDGAVRFVIVSERNEELVTPVDIISPAFARDAHALGHAGSHPIFDYAQPKKNNVNDDGLTIHQHDSQGQHDVVDDVWLSVSERGVIEIESNITSRRASSAGAFSARMVVVFADLEEKTARVVRLYECVLREARRLQAPPTVPL